MKLSLVIIVGLISINICACMSRETPKDYTYHETMESRSLMDSTDGKNGPSGNDHQCTLVVYPNCQGVSQSTQETTQKTGGN
ncbi:hypothetical protein PAHAL_9G410800 [Panicum hallii]|jgi:hypothetical protein|uniref:Uncharacterized protein n=1 Tax=Panicum hallii TaxID=206008 RepID=A0A2S3IPD5_9POAL|nr:hypothetical protein PAHAL_9G410800 [Panicum hallii]